MKHRKDQDVIKITLSVEVILFPGKCTLTRRKSEPSEAVRVIDIK